MMVFEMDQIMKYGDGNSKATVAVLLYLFRRIQKKLDGRPNLLFSMKPGSICGTSCSGNTCATGEDLA